MYRNIQKQFSRYSRYTANEECPTVHLDASVRQAIVVLDPFLLLESVPDRAVTAASAGRSLAVVSHVSAVTLATPVIRPSIVKATLICPRPRRAPAVPTRGGSRPGPAARAVRRPHAVMIAGTITCTIGPRSVPRRRARGSAADGRRSCVPDLAGLGDLLRRRWGDGAALAHHLDYTGDLVNRDPLGC